MITKNKTNLFKITKVIQICIVLAAICIFTSGCHGSKGLPEFSVPEEFDTSKTYELSFWAKNDSNKAQVNVYKKAIADFEALYPNIHVTLKQYTDYSRIYNDVITNISTNTTPNICITYPDHIATYMTGINIVAPLDELMADQNYGLGGSKLLYDAPHFSELVPEFIEEGKLDGSYYALPFMRSTEALYINKDLVEKLGYTLPDVLTWDFVFEVSEKAMEKNADGSFSLNSDNVLIPFIYKSTDNMLISMLKQRNAGYSDSEGNVYIFNDTTTEILKTISSHGKSGAFSTFQISSYPANFLNAGQCIFAVDSTAGSTWMGADAPLSDIAEEDKINFETVIRPIPQYDTEDIKMISQGPSLCVFNKEDPQEVLASYLFAQYLLTNDVQIGYSKTEGYIPVTLKAQNDPSYTEYLSLGGSDNNEHYSVKLDATKLLIENTSNTFVTPVFNGSASLRSASGALVEDVTKGVRRKNIIDDDFLQKEYTSVKSLYHLDSLSSSTKGKTELGPLPFEAKILLWGLFVIWLFIAGYVVYIKQKHKNEN